MIHIAERDTQLASKPKEFNEFVNTWSVDGFVSEGQQPAELGWGTHEKNFPRDGKRYDFGNGSAIYLMQPGAATRVRTWTPKAGHFHGFLITHGEAISIADYLSVRQSSEVVYRPTVHYSYHPSDSAVVSVHEFAGRNWHLQDRQRILLDEIISGIDELGVLLAGHKKNAYWYGSQLNIDEARKLAPHNNATSLQVTVSCLVGNDLGDGESERRARRARRDRLPAQPRDLHALSRHGQRAPTPTGRRCTIASGCSRKTSTRPIPGSSRTFACRRRQRTRRRFGRSLDGARRLDSRRPVAMTMPTSAKDVAASARRAISPARDEVEHAEIRHAEHQHHPQRQQVDHRHRGARPELRREAERADGLEQLAQRAIDREHRARC